jgi:hypothetical protein
VKLGKQYYDTESHEFNLGVEPKWANRSNISKDEAESLDVHPDYTDITFDFLDMENKDDLTREMYTLQRGIRVGRLEEQGFCNIKNTKLLQSKLGGVDIISELIRGKTQLSDEQIYRMRVKAHRVLRDVDGKPVVAIPNYPRYDSSEYIHANGKRIEPGKYSTIALSPNLWIARKDGKIAQSPYALHRHGLEYYYEQEDKGGGEWDNQEYDRSWDQVSLKLHTEQRFEASLKAEDVFNELNSGREKL